MHIEVIKLVNIYLSSLTTAHMLLTFQNENIRLNSSGARNLIEKFISYGTFVFVAQILLNLNVKNIPMP